MTEKEFQKMVDFRKVVAIYVKSIKIPELQNTRIQCVIIF